MKYQLFECESKTACYWEYEIDLPSKMEVCDRCGGRGTHTNPSIDGNGITGSEWAEMCHGDPDFSENYFGGMYDVTCEECHGRNVVEVIDEDRIPAEFKDHYEATEQAKAEIAREDAHYARMREMGIQY